MDNPLTSTSPSDYKDDMGKANKPKPPKQSKKDVVTEANKMKIDTTALSWRIFTAFVSGSQIGVTRSEVEAYVVGELCIPKDKIPGGLLEHLHVIVIAFMNMWSGWHFKGDFLAGKFDKELYFQRFQKYMRHKMNCVTRGSYASAVKEFLEVTALKECRREFAPYVISLECPPGLLNTIVFSNIGDDVIMKQHLGSGWQPLNHQQLLNWPHVEVSFRTADMFIVRRQATEYTRYLNYLPYDPNTYNEKCIEQTECYGTQECFSFDYLDQYIKVYLDALSTNPQATPSLLQECQTILSQFLQDVSFINVKKSMVTNTMVLFRLTPSPFIRNKKLIRNPDDGSESRVGYCEILDPKIQLFLAYFRPKQLDTPVLSFAYTEAIKTEKNPNVVIPKITYKCTFCKTEYQGVRPREQLFEHLQEEHRMEQHVRCTMCKKQFDVLALTACRWRHKCSAVGTVARVGNNKEVVEVKA